MPRKEPPMLAILILAQVASATPAPTPAPLGSASTAVSAKPKSLADVARERKLGKKGVAGGTLSVSGASGMPEVPAGGDSGVGAARTSGRYSRVRSAQADVSAARRAVDDAAVKT